MGEGKRQYWLSRCAASQALKGYNNVCLFALTISFLLLLLLFLFFICLLFFPF